MLRSMASRDEVLRHVEDALLAGPAHPFFAKALDYATEHGYGRAVTPVEASGSVTLDVVIRAE